MLDFCHANLSGGHNQKMGRLRAYTELGCLCLLRLISRGGWQPVLVEFQGLYSLAPPPRVLNILSSPKQQNLTKCHERTR